MHLSPLRAPRSLATFVMAMVIAVLPCSIATASPILLSFDVVLLQPGFPSEIDLGVAVTGGVEINNAGGTNVGAPFFNDEFIDFTSSAAGTSLAYMIQGGGGDHPIASGYSTSWPQGTAIQFSNWDLSEPGTLASVGVSVAGVVGAGGVSLVSGVDYVLGGFGSDALTLNLGGLGILNQAGQTPLGLMTFQLNFVADEPPNPVPDPASSLTLFGMGMAAVAARRPFTRRRQ